MRERECVYDHVPSAYIHLDSRRRHSTLTHRTIKCRRAARKAPGTNIPHDWVIEIPIALDVPKPHQLPL